MDRTDFLLGIFERFGKDNAQAALDFVRRNQEEKAVGDSAPVVVDTCFTDFAYFKRLVSSELMTSLDFFKRVNNLYLNARSEDNLDEKDMKLLANYTSACMVIVNTKRKIIGENKVDLFQSGSFKAVDLGLPSGKMWADRNVGAEDPELPGMYFDHYDACALEFPDNWELPEKGDFEELYENCGWEWTKLCGINGYKVKSKKNDNFIFFPAAGYGNGTSLNGAGADGLYWSRSLYSSASGYGLYFNSSGVGPAYNFYRFNGFSVRAVQKMP